MEQTPSLTQTCPNCGIEQTGKYCGDCGQRMDVKRLTFKEAFFDFWSRVYGFDSKFPRTLRDLTVRPGTAARRFINKNRALYYGPVGYFFLMATVFLIILGMIGIEVKDFLKGSQEIMGVSPPKQSAEQEALNNLIVEWISNNLRWVSFMVIPFNALSARYVFFRKAGLNVLEHMVLPFYLIGHMFWLSILSAFVYLFTGSFAVNSAVAMVTLAYFGFGYTSFVDYQPGWKKFLKGLGVYILGQMFFVITFMVLGIFAVIALNYLHPESLDFLRKK